MKILAFTITYILPPILAGILAQKLGKPIQKILERLFNNKHKA